MRYLTQVLGSNMRILLFIATLLVGTNTFAIDASDFDGLEGWTVAAATNISEEFNGCDFDKRIQFDNGWVLTCSEYSYSYSYHPDAVIFVKSIEFRSRKFWMVKDFCVEA